MPSRQRPTRLPNLPALAEQKLNKTTYTRGASLGEIYQNRVSRNNTVLIPFAQWDDCRVPDDGTESYERGFIVLVEPAWYFNTPDADAHLETVGLALGENALLSYRRRSDWVDYGPDSGTQLASGRTLEAANSRQDPLGGVYIARVPATIASAGTAVSHGFNSTSMRGAGIRVWEYASTSTLQQTKLQLEALLWFCLDVEQVMLAAGMTVEGVALRRTSVLESAENAGLIDRPRMLTLRMINNQNETICPLCMLSLSADDFLKRTQQAEGRAIFDLTTTQISLFHIQELRAGKLQHKVYNLGWGHEFCNTVVKDAGIMPTLQWMKEVLANQPIIDLEAERVSVEEAVDRG